MKLAAGVAASVLMFASAAHAQPSATPPSASGYAPAPQLQTWKRTKKYGGKVALADGISVGAMLAGVVFLVAAWDEDGSNDDDEVIIGGTLAIGGGIGLFVGGPLVHLSQDNSSSAWKSLALRLGAPLVLGLVAEAARGEDQSETPLDALPGLAFLAAMVIDWTVLAKVEVVETVPVYPYAGPTPGGGLSFGLTTTW